MDRWIDRYRYIQQIACPTLPTGPSRTGPHTHRADLYSPSPLKYHCHIFNFCYPNFSISLSLLSLSSLGKSKRAEISDNNNDTDAAAAAAATATDGDDDDFANVDNIVTRLLNLLLLP